MMLILQKVDIIANTRTLIEHDASMTKPIMSSKHSQLCAIHIHILVTIHSLEERVCEINISQRDTNILYNCTMMFSS
jgi:hypothetical protein